MIILINGSERKDHPDLMDQMHRLRASVFAGRLGWDVTVVDGRERDRFDDHYPLYVLSVTDDGKVVGCLRALQTTGPHMLADVFPNLVPPGEIVRSPIVWESTRFCVDMDYAATRSDNALSTITGELLCGLVETAFAAGIAHIVSVYDIRMERVLKRAGCEPIRLAEPQRVGGVLTIAGLFEVDQKFIDRLHRQSRLPAPSVMPQDLRRLGIAA
jgi:N-acyl-L-homoserine lactone synthetase